METKKGDVFKRFLDGAEFIVKRVAMDVVVLESRDGQKQVMTGIETLKNQSFYQKKEDRAA